MPHEFDSVELLEAVDCWPAGTPGTVVDVPEDGYLTVEVDEDRTRDKSLLDSLVDVSASAVRVTARAPHYA